MGRLPLQRGTPGKIRFHRSGQSWVARCGYRDHDDVTRTVERSGPTKNAAHRALMLALSDRVYIPQNPQLNADSRLSVVAELWWAAFATSDASLTSKDMYQRMMHKHIIPSMGNLLCREVTVFAAEIFLRRIEQQHGRASAKNARTVLSNICGYAARLGAMPRNPVRDTSAIRTKPKQRPDALDPTELRQLRAFVSYLPQQVRRDVPAVIDMLAATGLRLGECLAITNDAVDLLKHTVRVQGTVKRLTGIGVVLSRKPKTSAGYRTLTLPDWAMPIVEAHVRDAATLNVRVYAVTSDAELVIPARVPTTGKLRTRPAPWLQDLLDHCKTWEETIAITFPSAAGTFRDPSNTAHNIKAAIEFSGLDRKTSHLLRRCVATQMDNAGVPIREIADQLGQSRPSVTEDLYLARRRLSIKGATALEPFGFAPE